MHCEEWDSKRANQQDSNQNSCVNVTPPKIDFQKFSSGKGISLVDFIAILEDLVLELRREKLVDYKYIVEHYIELIKTVYQNECKLGDQQEKLSVIASILEVLDSLLKLAKYEELTEEGIELFHTYYVKEYL